MDKFFDYFRKIANVLVVIALSLMALLVFTNVVLRYVFGTGMPWAEELSRYLFIWMIFLGAIVALQQRSHLTVDLLTEAVPLKVKKILLIISNFLVLLVLMLILNGSWAMTLQNLHVNAPATGIPMFMIYGAGVVLSISMGVLTINNIIKLFKDNYFHDNLNDSTNELL